MLKKVLFTLILISLLPLGLYGQSVGKIIGQIADKDTGEPLPGVNVTLDNTLLGANTDIDGFFVILNVPVGSYDIRASYIGFQDMLQQAVRVSSGLTTEITFELNQTTLELDEVIVVTGQRPLVEKHVTQSYSLVTSENIETIPVRGFNELLNLQASVVVQDGNVYIRGGRADEVGYYLDGSSINNVLDNSRAVHIIQDAVEEIQVLAGGYTAEFGGANSGIVKTELKSGTADYHASFDVQTDNFTGVGDSYLGGYSYGNSIMAATFSGPVVDKDIRLFVAVENEYQKDSRVGFVKGYEFLDVEDTNPASDTYGETYDIVQPDGFSRRNYDNRWAVNTTLLFDFQPFQLRFSGVYNWMRTRASNEPQLNMFNDRQRYTDNNHVMLSTKFTHVLDPKTFYDVTAGYYFRGTETGETYFGTDWMKWEDSTEVSNHTDGRVTYRSDGNDPSDPRLYGISFNHNGADPGNYIKTEQSYFSGAAHFTTQFNKYNEIKAGVDFRYYTLRRYSMDADIISAIHNPEYPTIADIPSTVINGEIGNAYGYDDWGNEVDEGKNKPRNPVFISFYLQDKLEFKDLIINAGLRFDYFYADDKELLSLDNAPIDPVTRDLLPEAWKKKEASKQVSPRLGISFPVSERTVFYAQYGKFVQMPNFNNIYWGQDQISRRLAVGGFYYGQSVGFNIDPMYTTSYEIGFRQQLGDAAAMEINGFYKNVKGMVQTDNVVPAPGSEMKAYEYFRNGDFATTKGLEFRFTLRRTNRLQAQMNYTYTDAQGTASGNNTFHSAVYSYTQIPTITSPLNFENKHKGSINLDYRFGVDDGGPVLERLGLNFTFDFSSGHAFTRVWVPPGGQTGTYTAGTDYMADTRSREAIEPINSSTTPWTSLLNLRLDKTFDVWENLDATVYVRVNNILDTKNVLNVYEFTGTATDDGYINNRERSSTNVSAYGQEYVALYKALNTENGGAYLNQTGRELYGHPRQVWFGLKLVY